jgi:hypothetical protein
MTQNTYVGNKKRHVLVADRTDSKKLPFILTNAEIVRISTLQ